MQNQEQSDHLLFKKAGSVKNVRIRSSNNPLMDLSRTPGKPINLEPQTTPVDLKDLLKKIPRTVETN